MFKSDVLPLLNMLFFPFSNEHHTGNKLGVKMCTEMIPFVIDIILLDVPKFKDADFQKC